ncbi:superoxide dismutase [Paenibacillus pasadenensis]|uniref:superoxide dismutase n=1 Tax=Paenibacillus pasadenensis TaxID=217090 RepID=UPI00203D1930|nr:superoxide dismutase [Paenibacillus pasadenensis]MCM3748434.1 superoxide dismutase [Paenibacillus pasadenensis]
MARWRQSPGQQLLLENIKDWKLEEAGHISLILQSAPRLEPTYQAVLEQWRVLLERTAAEAEQQLESRFKNNSELFRAEPVTTSASAEGETAERGSSAPVAEAAAELRQSEAQADVAAAELLEASAAQSSELVGQLLQLLGTSRSLGSDAAARAVIQHTLNESTACLARVEAEQRRQAALTHEEAALHPEPQKQEEDAPAPPAITEIGRAPAHAGDWKQVPIGGHELPPLPYPYNALEPYIDEKTMRIHHDKHHQTYVNDLNKAEKQLQEARKTGNFDLVKHWERELAFNGAGHYLHTLFWSAMSPQGGGRPTGTLGDAIDRDFGSFDAFKKQYTEAANKVEGGGWAILVWSPRSRRLEILQAEKHQDLSQWDAIPLLPLDVWEHAYYLKHQNMRADYVKDWWNVVNWPYVNQRFEKARTLAWEPY